MAGITESFVWCIILDTPNKSTRLCLFFVTVSVQPVYSKRGGTMGFLKGIFGGKMKSVGSPVAGTVQALESVDDPVFAEGTMGDGAAVIPTEGKLYAPVSGKVIALFPTGHALGIQSVDGMEVLLHIGIDTVELKGEGFSPKIAVEDEVKAGQLLVDFDLELIKNKGYDPTVLVVVANSQDMGHVSKREVGETAVMEHLFWFD